MKKGKLIVVSGPSGVGKDTIVAKYLENNDAHLSISATTRLPREGEENNKDYYFLTKEEFEDRINKDDFLEYATYNNCYYGTPKSSVISYLEKGINVILVIEVKGAFQIKEKLKESVLVFIMPPSLDELKSRLKGRNTDSDEMINNRLIIAEKEMNLKHRYDYQILNDDINKAVSELKEIIEK